MKFRLKIADKILMICLLLSALGIYGFLPYWLGYTRNAPGYLVVSIAREEVSRFSLEENGRYLIRENGADCTIVVRDGKAVMAESNCKDQLCVKQGHISRQGQAVVCLPNRLVAEIVGVSGEQNMEVDDIAQ